MFTSLERMSFKRIQALLLPALLGTWLLGCQPDTPRADPNSTLPEENVEASSAKAPAGEVATFVPQQRPFKPEYLRQLRLPPGFHINVFAEGLQNPRMMAVGGDDTVYVTQPRAGTVLSLKDADRDGRADETQTLLSGLGDVHGITLHQGYLYLATPQSLYRLAVKDLGKVTQPTTLLSDLPVGGNHPNRTLAFGPDGYLYVSVGSSCNACVEANPEHATILRMKPDGSGRTVYAKGLRNTIGFGWHPETKEMWGMDHGSDWRGADIPPEELNRIEAGNHYGWPWCYGKQVPDEMMPGHPPGITKASYCKQTQPAVLAHQAHSSPIAFLFYTGSRFPADYRNDAFQVFRGSWNRKPAVGYKLSRIHFKNGQPERFEDFLTGFLVEGGQAQFARIAGLTMTKDGDLLLSDDQNGMIYRITYRPDAEKGVHSSTQKDEP